MCAIGAGSRPPPTAGDERVHRQPAERALVDEPQLRPVVGEPHPDPQVLLVGPAGVGDEHLPAHPEVGEHGVVARRAAVELQPQVLAAPADLGDRAAGQPGGEVGVRRRGAGAPRAGAPPRRRRSCGCSTCSARPRRTTSTSGSSGTARARSGAALAARGLASVSARQASSAAFCSASFLVRPIARAQVPAGDDRRGGEHLEVVRAFLGDAVLGHAEVAGRGELLQAGLPVQARPRAAGRCAAARRTAGARRSRAVSSPCSRYTAPIRASVASARMLGLSRPPVSSSPRPR